MPRLRVVPTRWIPLILTIAVATLSSCVCSRDAQTQQQDIKQDIESAAAAGVPVVVLRGVQHLTGTALVTSALTVRGDGAAMIDCQGKASAFIVRQVSTNNSSPIESKLNG
jgi:hypothetical protein